MRQQLSLHRPYPPISGLESEAIAACRRTGTLVRAGAEYFGVPFEMQGQDREEHFKILQQSPEKSLQHDLSMITAVGSIRQIGRKTQDPYELHTVNLSFGSLLAPNAFHRIQSAMKRAHLQPRDIVFEVTEPKHRYSPEHLKQVETVLQHMSDAKMWFLFDDLDHIHDRRLEFEGLSGLRGYKVGHPVTQIIYRDGINGGLSEPFKQAILGTSENKMLILEGVKPSQAQRIRAYFPPSSSVYMQGRDLPDPGTGLNAGL